MATPTLEQLLAEASARLAGISDSPRLDAELLLCHTLDKPRTYLRAWPERSPGAAELEQFQRLLERRAAGEPIAHLTGEREFWSLPLRVTADTLIPRPDTETLVEHALRLIPTNADWSIADLGTGSGAIALAVASERPGCRLVASDRSEAALAVARENGERLGLSNVEFRHGSWCEALGEEQFELILSNPPYIEADDPHLAQGDLRFEPHSALVGGRDGLEDIRQIVDQARGHLKSGGHLCLEHGYDQAERIAKLLKDGGYSEIEQLSDLAGQPRVSCGRRS